MELDLPPKQHSPPLPDLAVAIHRAAEAAAALSAPSSSTQAAAAVAALRDAHAAIGCFLSRLEGGMTPDPASSGDDQPMEDGCDEGEQQMVLEEVEEGLRDCDLQAGASGGSGPCRRRGPSGAARAAAAWHRMLRRPLWTWSGGDALPWISCCSFMRRIKGLMGTIPTR